MLKININFVTYTKNYIN